MVSLAFDVSAQGTIKGKVGDGTGEPLPGANVFIKGTTIGTITDFDGNFTLQGVPAGDHTIGVSFMGFETIEEFMKVVDGATVTKNYTLKEDSEQIDEVVVIGYGVQKKKLTTGANVQVSGDDIDRMKSTNALQALQGQTAGVNITSTSGQPGEALKVRVRGAGTLNGGDPLYIVDGVQCGDISYLNNSDIESIDILKDAASAAIYGSQASNGVVLITTKSGKAGHSQVYFDGYYGVQNLAKSVDLLGSEDYAMMMNAQALNEGKKWSERPFDLDKLPSYTSAGVANTNWIDEMFKDNAVIQNYSVGALGGNDVSTYSISMGYMQQEGIVGGKDVSNYERYNARINSEHKLYNGVLKVGEHMSYSHTKKNGIGVGGIYNNNLRSAFNVSPLLPMYDDNGNYFNTYDPKYKYFYDSEANPYADMMINNQNINKSSNVVGDIYLILEPIKNLKFRSSLGLDTWHNDSRNFSPIYELGRYAKRSSSSVSQNMQKGSTISVDNTLSYSFSIAEYHKFEAMAGMWMSRYDSEGMWASNQTLKWEDFDRAYLSNATSDNQSATMSMGGAPSQVRMLSYFGRLMYNYQEKYILNATVRADGSSRFTENNRWGYFPSVSLGWNISNESFMENQHIFDYLKIRGSWGQVGNQAISDFQYLPLIGFTGSTYQFGDSPNDGGEAGSSENGSYVQSIGNDDLKWETSEQLDLGFDARFLKNTLTVNFDFYKKSTKDWLIAAPVVATYGVQKKDAPFINGGNCNNTGIELGITYQNHVGKFNYSINLNGSYNKNEVTEIPTEDGIIHGSLAVLYNGCEEIYRCKSGEPIGFFWGYKTDGFYSQAEIDEFKSTGKINGVVPLQKNPKAGDTKYVDDDNNGKIEEADKVNLGDPNPDFTFGLSLSCDYKAFDFSVSTNGVAGNQIVQWYRAIDNAYANYTTDFLDYWKDGKGSLPRISESPTENYKFSDLMVKKGDFLRISNVTLGYDFCKQFKVPGFSQLRVYVTGQNLYTFTKYTGMDPEVGFGITDGVTNSFSSGIDVGYYPRPRTILFGVSIKL